MARRPKLPTIAELSDKCTQCGALIPPSKIVRLNMDGDCSCPECGKTYRLENKIRACSAPKS